MKKTVLKKYAELIVNKGVAVKKGQEVLVVADNVRKDDACAMYKEI